MKNKPYKLLAFDVGYHSYVEKKELLQTINYILKTDGTYDRFDLDFPELHKNLYFYTRFELTTRIGKVANYQEVSVPVNYNATFGDFYELDVALTVIEELTHNDISTIDVVHRKAGDSWGDVYRRIIRDGR